MTVRDAAEDPASLADRGRRRWGAGWDHVHVARAARTVVSTADHLSRLRPRG